MSEKEFDYISMIPFIDVMLVLLTIVLMTSTFIASGAIGINLPRTAGKHAMLTKTLVVTIDSKGIVSYEGKTVDMSTLKSAIEGLSKESSFLIRADKNIHLQGFVEVLDLIKTTGFKKVSLQTEWAGQ